MTANPNMRRANFRRLLIAMARAREHADHAGVPCWVVQRAAYPLSGCIYYYALAAPGLLLPHERKLLRVDPRA